MFKVPIANAYTAFGLHHRRALHLKETRVGKVVMRLVARSRGAWGPKLGVDCLGEWVAPRLPHNAAMPRRNSSEAPRS